VPDNDIKIAIPIQINHSGGTPPWPLPFPSQADEKATPQAGDQYQQSYGDQQAEWFGE
jgi:hypothetical protein